MLGLLAILALGCSTITEFEGGESSSSSTTTATEDPWMATALPSTSLGSTTLPQPGTTSDADTSTGGEAGCDFLGCDPQDVPPIEACDYWNDDCPRGEKCTFYSIDGGSGWNASKCVPLAAEPVAHGGPCTAEGLIPSGFDDCDTGSLCWVLDAETLEGHCVPFCTGSPEAPTCQDPDDVCLIADSSIPTFCFERCNPLDPDACFPGVGCYPDYDGGTLCRPDGSGPEAGGLFEPCSAINWCDPGLRCTGSQSVGACLEDEGSCCTPWCDLEAEDCPAPTSCLSAYEPGSVPQGQENVGYCGQDSGR